MSDRVVVLAGGTGGAKLARGMLDVVAPEGLTVIANTGDDIEIYEAYVCPDADLVTFWLADEIDPRGWGLKDDTFKVMDGLRQLGTDVWFNVGDRDLAIGLHRAQALAHGTRLTDAHAAINKAFKVRASVLPMSDHPVRTQISAHARWWPFQEFMIRAQAAGPIDDVTFHGVRQARPTPEVLDAVAAADVIVIGPSNPVISIGPILAVPTLADALRATSAPVVAVSPLVQGKVVKGPTQPFMAWAGRPLSSDGIAASYQGLIDGLVADEAADALPTHQIDVRLDTSEQRRRVADGTLRFAHSLG